jgi:hypothetical protein
VTFGNGLHGNAHGAELTLDWRTTSWLRTTVDYSYPDIQLTRDPGNTDVSQERRGEGLSPNHQVQLQLSADAPHGIQLDWMWRYVSRLPVGPTSEYSASNVMGSRQFARGFELFVVGRDLGPSRHVEWAGGLAGNTEIGPSGLIGVTWRP